MPNENTFQIVNDGLIVAEREDGSRHEYMDFHMGKEGAMVSYRLVFKPLYPSNGEPSTGSHYLDDFNSLAWSCSHFCLPKPEDNGKVPRLVSFSTHDQIDLDSNKTATHDSPQIKTSSTVVFKQVMKGIKHHSVSLNCDDYYFTPANGKLEKFYAGFASNVATQARHGVDCYRGNHNEVEDGGNNNGIYILKVRAAP